MKDSFSIYHLSFVIREFSFEVQLLFGLKARVNSYLPLRL